MKPIIVGVTTLKYDENGKVTTSHFTPMIEATIDPALEQELRTIEDSNNAEVIERNASLVLASWFNTVNHIELRDPERYELIPENVQCDKHQNGRISRCITRFVFRKRE